MLQRIIANSPQVASSNEPWISLSVINTLLKPQEFRAGDSDTHFTARAVQENSGIPYTERAQIAKSWLDEYYTRLSGACPIFLDKTPRYYKILPQLASTFPEARFIILKRYPADVCRSVIKTWKNYSALKLAKEHYEDLSDAPLLLQEFLESEYKNRSYCLRYEDIVGNAQSTLKRLFHWLKIDFQESFLDPSRSTAVEGSLGDQSNVHLHDNPKDLSDRSLDRSIFNEPFINSYLADLGTDFLGRYGYEWEPQSKLSPSYRAYKLYGEHAGARQAYRFGHFLKVRTLLAMDSKPLHQKR